MKIFVYIFVFVNFTSIRSLCQTTDNQLYLTVCAAGSGDFKTIGEAIHQVRDFAEYPVTIKIKKGIYREKIIIPAFKRHIKLFGEDRDATIITYDDYSGKEMNSPSINKVFKHDTYSSYTCLIAGNDCSIENLTIENSAGRVGQAVALHVAGDRIMVTNCNIWGNQDTFFLATDRARIYIRNSHIKGTTDFIFGAATAYFTNCIIESLSNSYITAASTTKFSKYGFIFTHCKILTQDSLVNKVYLGRPWRPYAKTIFMNCDLGKHITSSGWDAWKGDKNFPNKEQTVFFAEYNNLGEGSLPKQSRVEWAKHLTKKQARKITITHVFENWIPE